MVTSISEWRNEGLVEPCIEEWRNNGTGVDIPDTRFQ